MSRKGVVITGSKKTILTIDDSGGCRAAIRRLVESLGYNCLEAADGESGLAVAARENPDLVLLDVRMPVLDGYSAAQRYRETISQRTPIVMLTALDSVEARVKSIQAGANDVLTKPIARSLLEIRIQTLLRQELLYDQAAAMHQVSLALMKAMDAKSRHTGGHGQRCGLWAEKLGIEMGLAPERASILRIAGALHDIGKIGISDSVLNKPEQLNESESAEMRNHPMLGALILTSGGAQPIVINTARHHHERMDGRGYPDGIRAGELPLDVRIVQVADGFDAMTSRRPYRAAISPDEAIELLKIGSDQGQFDPEIVGVLTNLVRARKIYKSFS